MHTCPRSGHLQQFLDEQLGADDAATLTQHLETCAACRQALDHLSADADSKNWRRLREQKPQTDDEPRPDFMRRLGGVLAPGSALSRAAQDSTRIGGYPTLGSRLPTPEGYEILEKRGRGGSSIVYKARDLRLKRTVALKMLLTGVEASAEERTRLRAEAEAVARLQHPNIVQIHEIGEQSGRPFLVLEFVEGQNLSERLEGTPQLPPVAAKLVETVARAVHYAHEHGVVHRDLKPANILLAVESPKVEGRNVEDTPPTGLSGRTLRPSDFTTPKITDFGLAKRLDEASQTQTGQVLGTPSYMAPEQARGQSKLIGPAADIYALGAILYQVLTGRPPFQGVTAVATIMQVLHEEPVPPRRLQPAVPRDLETICLKCLAKEPGKRYPSALELAEDLRRFQAGESILARPVGLFGQARRWVRRNPAATGLLAALVLVLVAGVAGVTWSYLGAEAAREREAHAQRLEAEQRALAELRLSLSYFSYIALAEREWQMNNVARAEYLLDLCVPSEGGPDRRGWEWYYLKRLCHTELLTVKAHRAAIAGLAFSPNGKYLASSAGDRGFRNNPRITPGELTIWDAAQLKKLGDCVGHAGRVDGVAFDISSSRLVSISADNTARLWNVSNQRELALFPIRTYPYWRGAAPAFSPNGETLALPSLGELRLVDLASGVASRRPAEHTDWAGPCAFSPDGTLLALGGSGAAAVLIVWDVVLQCERYRLPAWSCAAAFSPDGRVLATNHGNDVLLADAATGRAIATLRGHDGAVYDLAWSPDRAPDGSPECRFLATVGADQTARVWDVRTGREHRVFRGHTEMVQRVAYHPSGRQIVTGDAGGVLKAWNVDRDQRVLELSTGRTREPARDVAFTADGQGVRAIRSEAPGAFWGWDLKTGRRTFEHPATLPVRDEWPLQYLALSADGRFCAGPLREDLKTLRVWNVETGEPVSTLSGHKIGVRSVVFSPDGRRLASASGEKGKDEPHELFVWQLPGPGGGEPARIELACEAPVQTLAFSADGRRLVAGERGRQVRNERPPAEWPWVGHLSVWDTGTGQLLNRWPGHSGTVQSVAFDPKGRWIASGRWHDQVVRVWDADTGKLLHDLRGPTALTCVTFNPDGTRLAAVGYEGRVHLWDPATGLDVLTLRGPGPRLPEGIACDTRVVFSPDGTRLAVNSWTGAIYIWDARPLDR